jgi:hypothetical protein
MSSADVVTEVAEVITETPDVRSNTQAQLQPSHIAWKLAAQVVAVTSEPSYALPSGGSEAAPAAQAQIQPPMKTPVHVRELTPNEAPVEQSLPPMAPAAVEPQVAVQQPAPPAQQVNGQQGLHAPPA